VNKNDKLWGSILEIENAGKAAKKSVLHFTVSIPPPHPTLPVHISFHARIGSLKAVLVAPTLHTIANYFLQFVPLVEPFLFSIQHEMKKVLPPKKEEPPKPVPSMLVRYLFDYIFILFFRCLIHSCKMLCSL
jgi:hypothetical protein